MEKKTEQTISLAYEKPEIKDFGDLFELTASGSARGGHDQPDANDPEAVKRVAPDFRSRLAFIAGTAVPVVHPHDVRAA